MLKYFFITWVVAFFVFCLPLLFITTKEKEAMSKIEGKNSKEYRKKVLSEKDLLNDYEEYNKLSKKRSDILFRTGMLNTIFLIILPYVIAFDFNISFSFYIISLVYLIIPLFFVVLFNFPGFFFGSKTGDFGDFFLIPGVVGSMILVSIYNSLREFIYGPGEYLVNLAIK